MIDNYMLYKNIKELDLHGLNRYQAIILTNEFINDCYKQKIKLIKLIHGKGQGILKREIHKTLKTNKLVKDYKTDIFNDGVTIVEITSIN